MKFRILSYNIHRAIGLDRRFQPARIMQVLREHDPDIVLLQEVDKGVPRSREMDMAVELAAGAVSIITMVSCPATDPGALLAPHPS